MREPRDRICVIAIGAHTAVGMDAASTAAAVRAGISGICRHPTMVDHAGDPFMVAMDPSLRASGRDARMLQLAGNALAEVLAPLDELARGARVFLGLPEAPDGPGTAWVLCRDLQSAFANLQLEVQGVPDGNAAGMLAIELARAWLASNPDRVCIVGGVDSCIDADVLEQLDAGGQLASASHRWGFPPGEGAGMLALCRADLAQRHRLKVLGSIASVATGTEPHRVRTDTICLGIGLADVMRRAATAAGLPIGMQYCDLNGERYREHEFSYAALRVADGLFVNAIGYVAPVDCWGHVGAASAPLLMLLPLANRARGVAASGCTMAWCGSDNGHRGAAVLQFEGAAR